MIKLNIIAFLCIALIGPVITKISEKKIGEDGWHFVVDIDDNRSCEDKCLASENSKKISDQILYVLHAAENSYDVLRDLLLIDLMYSEIGYKEWANHIKRNDFDYEGYDKLQNYVNRYKVCKNVCKVYSQLRNALKKQATEVKMYENDHSDGSKDIEVIGELCILADMYEDLQRFISEDRAFNLVTFDCQVFIADVNLVQELWTGMDIYIHTSLFVVPRTVTWDVSAMKNKKGKKIGRDGSILVETDRYEAGENEFTTIDSGGDDIQ